MSSRQLWRGIVAGMAAACMLLAGCGGGSTSAIVVSVSLNASSVLLIVNQTFTFAATVTGATDTTVTWKLTSTTTANTTATACSPGCGTIDANGLYTAPAVVPNPTQTITVTATSNADKTKTATATAFLDSGIRVSITPSTATIGTGETFRYTATLTTDVTPNDVTWLATQDTAPSATSTACVATTCGSVDANGNYTAPATVPATATVTILAVSKLDTARFATASAMVVTAATPTFTGIVPAVTPLGTQQLDVYLIADNLRSTLPIQFNNVQLPDSQIKFVGAHVARIRLLAADLSVANASSGLPITVLSSTGTPINTFNLTFVPVRAALVRALPDSTVQTAGTIPSPITLNGGYFGTLGSSSLAVTEHFDGGSNFSIGGTGIVPRQIQIVTNAGALSTPGLYQVSLQNNDQVNAPGVAATNIAVQPVPTVVPSTTSTTMLSLVTGPGNNPAPSAIAMDTTAGTAIVANKGDDSVQLITVNSSTSLTSGARIALGAQPNAAAAAPVGVVVDEVRHVAAVANSTGQSVSIVDLTAGTVLSTIDLSKVTALLPAAVGLEPTSGLGLVAFSAASSSTPANVGVIFNYDPSATPVCLMGAAPYCVTGVVGLSTGPAPQIAFEPRLRLAIVTPGGAGVLSVVDLGRQVASATIAAGPTGAVRKANVVTITTTTPHNLNTSRPGTVLITGVADTSFNGSFSVTGVPSPVTFTYAQTAADATSGGGQVNSSAPLLQTLPAGDTHLGGIAINPFTQKAFLTDSNNTSGFFINTQNQDVTAFVYGSAEIGAKGASFQPFTNVAVSVNPTTNELSLIDPVTPKRLTTIATGGTGSAAVVVDPSTNVALVANSTSNDVTEISLAVNTTSVPAIKPLQVSGFQIAGATCATVDPTRQIAPQATPTSSNPLCLKVFGSGFAGSPQVRLDGVSAGAGTVVSNREVDITVPASFLAAPRRYALDVAAGGVFSNVTDLTVVGVVDMTAACPGTNPVSTGVAVDDVRNLAVVTNAGCGNISIIDLTNLANITATSFPVGTAPTGVDVIPRLGWAAIANSNIVVDPASPNFGSSLGAGTVTIFDLVAKTQVAPAVTVGTRPSGVAFNQDTGNVLVVNSGSNTISVIDLTTAATPTTTSVATVDQQPVSVAVDPDHRVALVGTFANASTAASGVLDIFSLVGSLPSPAGSISASPTIPTGVVYDPLSTGGDFFVVSSLSNLLTVAHPQSATATSLAIGVNPTSVAYNPNTGTVVTVNSQSNTLSIVDTQTLRVIATLELGKPPQTFAAGSSNPQFGVAIHSRLNLAIIVDPYNIAPGVVPAGTATGRVLIYPLP